MAESAAVETMELVAEGLNFPTSVAFDGRGVAYVAESGLPFAGAPAGGRVLRVEEDGSTALVAEGLSQPVNGLTWHQGGFYVSEGGYPGRISRLTPDGERTTVLDGLPGLGNYHTNMVAVGPDGKLYFSQGAMTNSGIVGLDSYQLGWLRRLPDTFDVPGYDVVLAGVNVETPDPRSDAPGARAVTGAFVPFGTRTHPGQRIPGRLPCTASVMRCNPDGSELELVAWGIRNAYGIGFLPDGRLLATDQGADDRGSRPVGGVPDLLFEVREGAWYGWPDYVGTVPVSDPRFRPAGGTPPEPVLHPDSALPPPEPPLLEFPVNAAATKFDVAPAGSRWVGQVFVCLFGDERPLTGPAGPRVGRSLARIDPSDWSLHAVRTGPLHRPIDARFHPQGALYVVDFGEFEMDPGKVTARAGSGKLWKIHLD